ncbi:MAG: hypothetical protein ACYC2K_05295 [Gemmatimonadales bacterium]
MVAVSVNPVRRGLLGRIGQGLSVVRKDAPVTLEWAASPAVGPITGRAFELGLERLGPGQYLIVLEIRSGSASATVHRLIRLTN